MWPVRMNGELLDALIKERFTQGTREFQSVWDANGGLDRSTIHRWRKGGLPKSSNAYLHLCGLLDIDPFALLSANRDDVANAVEDLLASYEDSGRGTHPALAFARHFFGRKRVWPPKRPLNEHYGKLQWCVAEFVHNPSECCAYYKLLCLVGDSGISHIRPQVFHFAYRHPILFGKRWLQYGFVIRIGKQARLVHINGHTESYLASTLQDPTFVETYFGEGPAVFRIASIHPFELIEPEDDSGVPRLRFPG